MRRVVNKCESPSEIDFSMDFMDYHGFDVDHERIGFIRSDV